MRHISRWFSTDFEKRDDPDWDGETPWYQWAYEWYGERVRLTLGDIAATMESETGEAAGLYFGGDLRLWENTGQFDTNHRDKEFKVTTVTRYRDHSFTFCLWRWGIYLAWRGGRDRTA